MDKKSVVVRDVTMKEKVNLGVTKKQKNAMALIIVLLILITALSLAFAFLRLGIVGCVATLTVFIFVFIKFSGAYAQLRDFGYRNRGIEVFKVVCAIVYCLSFILNVFLA